MISSIDLLDKFDLIIDFFFLWIDMFNWRLERREILGDLGFLDLLFDELERIWVNLDDGIFENGLTLEMSSDFTHILLELVLNQIEFLEWFFIDWWVEEFDKFILWAGEWLLDFGHDLGGLFHVWNFTLTQDSWLNLGLTQENLWGHELRLLGSLIYDIWNFLDELLFYLIFNKFIQLFLGECKKLFFWCRMNLVKVLLFWRIKLLFTIFLLDLNIFWVNQLISVVINFLLEYCIRYLSTWVNNYFIFLLSRDNLIFISNLYFITGWNFSNWTSSNNSLNFNLSLFKSFQI